METLKNQFKKIYHDLDIYNLPENIKKTFKTNLSKIEQWIEKNWEFPEKFFRINLYPLSNEIELELVQLIDLFLFLVKEGIFILNWEYHCPHCNAVPDFKHNFSDLRGEGFCPLCDVKFRNILDENIEVTFTIHPQFYKIPEEIEEKYRTEMHQKALEKQYLLEKPFLSGLECLNSKLFQEFFGNQVLSVEESLGIQNIILMFTDLKGSTAMYRKYGDTVSYNIVREHFKLLFNVIENHNGIIIKTIGDAVMASFIKSEDAMQSALEIFNNFLERIWDPAGYLEVKIGLHKGPVIVVNLNDRIDYFGNTVNIASRIQSQLKYHSIGFTDAIYNNDNIKTILRQFIKENKDKDRIIQIYRKNVKLKGIDEEMYLYYLKSNKFQ
ncbi:MAG: guanylate cyclase [Leptospiraceae bacterium]|nr:MAG: guanylate cyclase [Leptospiraceae bacterium]